jgi:hypothetical protein
MLRVCLKLWLPPRPPPLLPPPLLLLLPLPPLLLPLFSLFASDFDRSATVSVKSLICAVMLLIWASFAFVALLMLAASSAVFALLATVALAISWIYFWILSPTSATWFSLS